MANPNTEYYSLKKLLRIFWLPITIILILTPIFSIFFVKMGDINLQLITPIMIIFGIIGLSSFLYTIKKNSLKLFHSKNMERILASLFIICTVIWVGVCIFGSNKITISPEKNVYSASGEVDNITPKGYLIISHTKGSEILKWEIDLTLYLDSGIPPLVGTLEAYIYSVSGVADSWRIDTGELDSAFTFSSINPATVCADSFNELITTPSSMVGYTSNVLVNNSYSIFGFGNYQDTWSCYEIWSSYNNCEYIGFQSETVELDISWTLKPTIILDSEYFNLQNVRCEVYDGTTLEWIEQPIEDLTIVHPQYKIKLYDSETNDLIYSDSTSVNFTTSRTIEIDSFKLINNSGENANFTLSEQTTSYNNGTYNETVDSITMNNGTKDASAPYTELDNSDASRVNMDCNTDSSASGYTDYNYTDTVDSISMTDGTHDGSDPYTELDSNDGNYVTYSCDSEYWDEGTDTEQLFPNADITVNDWTEIPTDGDHYENIDSINTGDYLWTTLSPGGTIAERFELQDSSLTDSYDLENATVHMTVKQGTSGSKTWTTRLNVGSTWLAEYTEVHDGTTQFTFTKTWTFTGSETISDFDGALFQFKSADASMYCYYFYFTLGYSGGSESNHTTDGYMEFDYSSLGSSGNITSRSDINDIGLNYRFYSNISQTITISAYDWDATTWDVLTSSNPTSEIAYSNYSLGTEYLKNDVNDLLFRLKLYGFNESTGFYTEFELATLELQYDNQNNPFYDSWHELEAIIQFNYTDIGGDISDREDILATELNYSYYTNISQTISVYAYDWTNTEWDILSAASYTSLTMVSNTSLDYNYFKNDVTDLLFKLKIVGSLSENDVEIPSGFDCEFDIITLNLTFTNISSTSSSYVAVSSFFIIPYNFGLSNCSDSNTYAIFVYDVYGNVLYNETGITFTDHYDFSYIPEQTRTCLISLSDQQGNYIDYPNYKVKLNGTLLYEQYFYREIDSIWNISVYDRFDTYITSTLHTVDRDDNFISIQLILHSLKIYNQQGQFAWFNITQNPATSYYWSEWLAPNEVTEFKLISGNYRINITEYESSTSTNYDYTLNGDDLLLISSVNTLGAIMTNIANVNTTIGNLITNVEINITNQNSAINNSIINLDINIDNLNSSLGNLLIDLDTDITNIASNISSFWAFTNTSLINLNSSIDSQFVSMNTSVYNINSTLSNLIIGVSNELGLVNTSISTLVTAVSTDLLVLNSTIDSSLFFVNTTLSQIGNNITSNYILLNNSISQVNNNISAAQTAILNNVALVNNTISSLIASIESDIYLVNNSIYNAIVDVQTSLTLTNNSISGNLSVILGMNEYLTQLYQATMFSDLLNWTDAYRNSTFIENQIDTWSFVNSYETQSLEILLRYNNVTDSIIIGAGDTISQVLPNDSTEHVEYRVKSLATDEYLTDWADLPDNRTIDFGFYDAEVPIDDIKETNLLDLIPAAIILIVVTGVVIKNSKDKIEIKQNISENSKKKKKDKNYSFFAEDSYLGT